jgi:primase-polymerase (primpol)-like protein
MMDYAGGDFKSLPDELKKLKRWVFWKLTDRTDKHGNTKKTKPPTNWQGQEIDCYDPGNWHSLKDAISLLKENQDRIDGIGFVVTPDLGLVAIDLDHIDLKENPYLEWIKRFNTYTEISISGKGLHLFLRGKKPGAKCKVGNVEMYNKHYFTVSANPFLAVEIREAQGVLDEFYQTFLTDATDRTQGERKVSSSICSPVFYAPLVEDEKIIQVATRAKNGQKFLSLMDGNISGYTSQSDADLALCSILAFYTQDIAQIERIFNGSSLNRDKWNRADYRKSTIEKAIRSTYSKFEWRYTEMNNLEVIKDIEEICPVAENNKIEKVKIVKVVRKTDKAFLFEIVGINGVVKEEWIAKKSITDFEKATMLISIPGWLYKKIMEVKQEEKQEVNIQ